MKETLKKILIEMLDRSYPMVMNVIIVGNESDKNIFFCFLNINRIDFIKIGEEELINYVSDIASYMGVKFESVFFY